MPQKLCDHNAGCTVRNCAFHHVSPAANFEKPTGDLKQKPCFKGAQCTNAGCLFNHPSPCTWREAGGRAAPAPSKSVRADATKHLVVGKAGGDGEEVAPAPPLIADAAEPSLIAPVAKQSEEVDNPLRCAVRK